MITSPYRNALLIRFGNFMFRYRNAVFPVGLAVLIAACPPAPAGSLWASPWLDSAALLAAFAGESLRVLTVGLEYIKRGGLNKRVYASHLVTDGIFAHCRNPLYVGNLVMAIALLAISGRPLAVLIGGVLIVLIYVAIVAAEENYLRAAFPGEYEAYCRATSRWVPDLRGLGDTLGNSRFHWRRVLLKESSSFYAWIVLAFLLSAIKGRFSPAQTSFEMFLGLFVVATLGFATIRLLKRTRRLQL